MKAREGDSVKIRYVGRTEDGKIFDRSDEDSLLGFTVGARQVISGLENAVVGMHLEQEKEVRVETDAAYGEWKEEFVRDIPRKNLPDGIGLEPGKRLTLNTGSGHIVPALVKSENGESVSIDFNHPLAGKRLMFSIKLEGINRFNPSKLI